MQFTLADNILIGMTNIHQWTTYDGLMGAPSAQLNHLIIEGLKKRAKQYCQTEKVYIIEPIKMSDSFEQGQNYLPRIMCLATLNHFKAYRNKNMNFSFLVVAWFQENYALPIEADIIEKIKGIPWKKVALEYQF